MKLPAVEKLQLRIRKLATRDGAEGRAIAADVGRIVDALAEALEPFADQCSYGEDTHDASDCEISVKLFELRRARAALALANGK